VPAPSLILASTSRYRRELLGRLGLPFETASPGVDEAPRAGEPPAELALRLAVEKAQTVARHRPDALVIGADQVAELDGIALSKPGTHDRAVAQLRAMRGRRISFLTAVAVSRAATHETRSRLVPTEVDFRDFDDATIDAYLRADRPYDCAGAAKIESLGIALVERVVSEDPTALIGLPLIRLTSMLLAAGVPVIDNR
jgi:septum formation protein